VTRCKRDCGGSRLEADAAASKNELKIRRAKSADAQRIAELSGQLGYRQPRPQMRERLRGIKPVSQHAVLVAETAEDGVIGWLHVSRDPLLEVEIRAEVNGLVVAEGQRSAGAGAGFARRRRKSGRESTAARACPCDRT